MRNLIVILVIVLNFNICNAQKNKNETMIPKITDDIEKLDISIYKDENEFIFKGDLQMRFLVQSFGFAEQIFDKKSYFNISKLFYNNKLIKKKGISINNGSQYGIWYEFNEQGVLIKEIDTDEGYIFTWQKVLEYCEEEKIEITKGYIKGGYQTSIFKEELDGKKVWVISHLISPVLICKKTLDGTTGELINSEEIEFINH